MPIFAYILQKITGKLRTKVTPGVDFEWSDNLWTHNIFRAYEVVFGRRWGNKPESTTDSEGNEYYHSFESVIVYTEYHFRCFLKKVPRPSIVKVYIPVLATIGLQQERKVNHPYLFAIAFDAPSQSTSSSATTKTWTHVTSGSNTIMFEGIYTVGGRTISSNTYNSVAITAINTATSANGQQLYWNYLIAPTTGSNSVSYTTSGSAANTGGLATTYSGAKQSSQPDSSNTGTSAGPTDPFTINTTVVATGCWIAGYIINNGNAGGGSNTVLRTTDQATYSGGLFDTNGTVGTGSQAFNVAANGSSFFWAGCISSFAPSPAVGPTNWKTWNTVTVASNLKTLNTNAIANIKSYDTIT